MVFFGRIIIHYRGVVRSVHQIIFALALVRTVLLDGYECKSWPLLHQHNAIDSPVHSILNRHDRLAVMAFNFTVVIINSTVDNFWANISGRQKMAGLQRRILV